MRRQFREARTAWPAEPTERLFFRVLRTTPLVSSPFAQKIAIARTVLTQAMLDAPVGVGVVLGWLTVYGSVFAVGCVAMALSLGNQAMAGASEREPAHVVAVAPLPCPETAKSDPAASAGGETWRAGAGLFGSPDAAAAAMAKLKGDVPGVVVRALGPALLIWAPLAGDDDNLAPRASTARDGRVAAALGAAGGRYYDPTSFPIVECTATDVASAQATGDRLETYLLAARSSIDLAAPWEGDDKPTDDQEVARRTFRVAMGAGEGVHLDLGSTRWWSNLRRKAQERACRVPRAARAGGRGGARLGAREPADRRRRGAPRPGEDQRAERSRACG